MLHHKEHNHLKSTYLKIFIFRYMSKKLAEKLWCNFHVSLFQKFHLQSTSFSTTHLAQLWNQSLVRNYGPTNRTYHLSWYPSYQRMFVSLTDIIWHHHIHLLPRQEKHYLRHLLEQFVGHALPFGKFILRCLDCPHLIFILCVNLDWIKIPLTCIYHKPKFIFPSNFSIPNFKVCILFTNKIFIQYWINSTLNSTATVIIKKNLSEFDLPSSVPVVEKISVSCYEKQKIIIHSRTFMRKQVWWIRTERIPQSHTQNIQT